MGYSRKGNVGKADQYTRLPLPQSPKVINERMGHEGVYMMPNESLFAASSSIHILINSIGSEFT